MPHICTYIAHSTHPNVSKLMSLLSSENIFVSESLDGVCSTSDGASVEVFGDSTEINSMYDIF